MFQGGVSVRALFCKFLIVIFNVILETYSADLFILNNFALV